MGQYKGSVTFGNFAQQVAYTPTDGNSPDFSLNDTFVLLHVQGHDRAYKVVLIDDAGDGEWELTVEESIAQGETDAVAVIHTEFTPVLGLPMFYAGDIGTFSIMQRAFVQLDQKFNEIVSRLESLETSTEGINDYLNTN